MYVHDDEQERPCSPGGRRQCKSHGVTKCDADPEHLFRVGCSRCDYVKEFDPTGAGAAKYLYYRRRTRAARGLLSVGAPLDGPSAAYLCQAAAECGIVSNTSAPHVTFVEGLVPDVDHTASIGRLRAALFRDPKLTVVSVHRVPRRDNATDLILADVILSPGADAVATGELSDGKVCHLPQFPFHVALGACPRARGGSKWAASRAEQRLKGVALAFDATRVRVLPPPEGSKKLLQPRHGQHAPGGHGHSPQRQHHHQPHPKAMQHQHPSNGHSYGNRGHHQGHVHGHHAAPHPHTPPRVHYSHHQPHHQPHQQQHSHYAQQQQYYSPQTQQQQPQWAQPVPPPMQQQPQSHQAQIHPHPQATNNQQHQVQQQSRLLRQRFAISPAPSFGACSVEGSALDDAASTSGSSATSVEEQAEIKFPGLAVDLDFLDEPPKVATGRTVSAPASPTVGAATSPVPASLTSIWAQA